MKEAIIIFVIFGVIKMIFEIRKENKKKLLPPKKSKFQEQLEKMSRQTKKN